MKACHVLSLFALAGGLLPHATQAAPNERLVEMINAYRADPPPCEGNQKTPLPPLSSSAALAQIKIDRGVQLQDAIRSAGIAVSRAEVLKMSGPSTARDALQFAAKRNCRLLLSERYSIAGVSQQGQEWQIVLAQPLLDPDLGDWQQAGQQVLKLVNAARAKERRCGSERYAPAPALRWNALLGTTALKHSRDMATHDYFGHTGRNGSTVATRARNEGYAWRNIGENVAAGQGSVQQVVDGWLASPGHCANIMNSDFSEMGAAYATSKQGDMTIYWTQVFGTPR